MTGPAEKATPRASTAAPKGLVLPIRDGEPPEGVERRGGRTEAEWREIAASLRAEILAVTEDVKALEQNPGGMAERKLVCPDGQPQCWNPKMESSSPGSRLIQGRRRLAALNQAVTALEDEARRQSVPPGWLR
jgi:hypothetical protein